MAYEVNIKGLEKLDELIAKAERLGDALGGVKDQAEGIGAASGVASAKTSSATTGIYSRRDRYRAEHDDLISRGVSAGTEYNDAKVRMLKSEKAVERWEKSLEPKSEADKLRDVLMTSRIGPDGKLYPIVGRMMSAGLLGEDALGNMKAGLVNGGGIAGKLARAMGTASNAVTAAESAGVAGGAAGIGAAAAYATPAAIALAAVAAMKGSADSFASTMRERSNAYYIGGGGARGTDKLIGMGFLSGESPAELARNAVGFGDRLREGGYGASYMRQRGLVDRGIWQTDKATNYTKALKFLMEDPDEGRVIRVARDLGMEDKLWMRDIDKDRRDRIINGSGGQSGEKGRKSAANYDASKAELDQAWSNVWNQVGDFSARTLTRVLQPDVYSLIGGGAIPGTVAESIVGKIKDTWDMARQAGENAARLNNGWDPSKPRKKRASGGVGASASNEGIGGNDDFGPNVGRAPREETIGGGDRVRRAVPAGWRQIQMDDALSGQAANLGAFNL
jgi:hypothetical protein